MKVHRTFMGMKGTLHPFGYNLTINVAIETIITDGLNIYMERYPRG